MRIGRHLKSVVLTRSVVTFRVRNGSSIPLSPSLVTTAYCAPAALRPCRFATPSQARRWLRSTPSNGWKACRMRLHMASAGLGPIGPGATPAIRAGVRLPGTTRPRFALHGAQRGLDRIRGPKGK